jgi:hypothetical protein
MPGCEATVYVRVTGVGPVDAPDPPWSGAGVRVTTSVVNGHQPVGDDGVGASDESVTVTGGAAEGAEPGAVMIVDHVPGLPASGTVTVRTRVAV